MTMAEERLAEIESRYSRDRDNSLGADDVRELMAEVKRLRYEQSMDLNDVERFRGNMRKAWDERDALTAKLKTAMEALRFVADHYAETNCEKDMQGGAADALAAIGGET